MSKRNIVKRPSENVPTSPPNIGKNYLFIIAIDEYQHCPPLFNAVKDASDLIKVLTTQYHFKPENVISLFNEQATEGNIIHSFRDLARSLTAQDNLLLFFSGHGEYDNVFKEGYWIPVNAKQGAFEDYIPNSKIKTVLNAIDSHHTFLISDSCFSGSLFMQYRNVGGVAERLEKDPSRWGLTAGRNEIVEDGQPGSNSPFADSLVYHLKNNDKALGVGELCNKVIEEVVANASQTPRGEPLRVEGHRGGQFFFHPKGEQQIEAAPRVEKIQNKRGNILYNIPATMELERDTRCEVRIAFDKETLLQDLDITDDVVVKDIRISNLMEVDLICPFKDEAPFSVRRISSQEQFIDEDDYTQWIFYVKALKAGKFPLILKVTVVEVIHGKERKREIVLEEMVEIVTTVPDIMPEVAYKKANYAFAISEGVEESVVPEIMPSPVPSAVDTTFLERKESPVVSPQPVTQKSSLRKKLTMASSALAAILILVFAVNTFYFDGGGGGDSNKFVNPKDDDDISPIVNPSAGEDKEDLIKKEKPTNSKDEKAALAKAEKSAWEKAKKVNTLKAYNAFLSKYSTGLYSEEARKAIEKLKEKSRPQYGSFKDDRNGYTYKTIKMGDLTWLAENLNYEVEGGSWCLDDKPDNCKKFGRFYTWEAVNKACPDGWRIPRYHEWQRMVNKIGQGSRGKAAAALLEGGKSGLNIQIIGQRSFSGTYANFGTNSKYWSETQASGSLVHGISFSKNNNTSYGISYIKMQKTKESGPCRCVK